MTSEAVPFLSLNGQGNAALDYYTTQIGAELLFKQTYADVKALGASMDFPAEQADWVSHSVLRFPGGAKVMLNEAPLDNQPAQLGNTQSICMQSQDLTTIQTLYTRFTKEPQNHVIQPLMALPFSPAYGIVVDPFGVIWQLFATTHSEF